MWGSCAVAKGLICKPERFHSHYYDYYYYYHYYSNIRYMLLLRRAPFLLPCCHMRQLFA